MNKIDEHKIQEAYEEAITHLEVCAEQEQEDSEQQRAYVEVASRISKASERSLILNFELESLKRQIKTIQGD